MRRYELWESGSYELTKSAQSFGEGFRGDARTYMVGEKQERSDLPASFVVPGHGVWSAKFDTVAGTMHADMETDFIGEQHMYDWPDYPAEAPNLKEPVREEREAGFYLPRCLLAVSTPLSHARVAADLQCRPTVSSPCCAPPLASVRPRWPSM